MSVTSSTSSMNNQNHSDLRSKQIGEFGSKEVFVIPSSHSEEAGTICCLAGTVSFFAMMVIAGIVLLSVGASAFPMSAGMILSGKICLGIGLLPLSLVIGIATDGKVCICCCFS